MTPIIWYALKTADLLVTQIGLSQGLYETNPLFNIYLARWFNVVTTFFIYFAVKYIKDKWFLALIKMVLWITAIDVVYNLILIIIN